VIIINYFLDYQEHYDADVRFTDRITSASGEWSGNIFDFFFKIYNKLIQHPKIKIPFKMKDGLTRIDDTPIHKALREALANCLNNADFYGERGLIVRNNLNEIIIENPGCFRIELIEALSGGVSSPRNSVVMKMFGLLDIGERIGSGIPLIYQAWKDEGFDEPKYTESLLTNRTVLSLALTKTSERTSEITSGITSGITSEITSGITSGITSEITSGITSGIASRKNKRKKQAGKTSTSKSSPKGALRKQAIIQYLATHTIAKTAEIAESLGISDSRVRAYLLELIREGLIVVNGETHNRVYRLNEKN